MHRLALLALGAALAAEAAAVEAPAYLEGPAKERFAAFRDRPEHRAFALGPGGAWGQAYNHENPRQARRAALGYCREHADECIVIAVNDRILAEADPFPGQGREPEQAWFEGISGETADLLAGLGLFVLVAGTFLAQRYPLMLRGRNMVTPSGTVRLRLNYTWILFAFVYFMALMPTFARTAPAVTGNPATWLYFGAPIIPAVLSVLYLHARGKLGERIEAHDKAERRHR